MKLRATLSAARANTRRAPRRGRWALALSVLAVAWGVALVAAAFVLPAYNDGSPLTASVLLLAFSVIALLSIGALTAIPALMLAVAARLTPSAARA
jgi:hypothetical protein